MSPIAPPSVGTGRPGTRLLPLGLFAGICLIGAELGRLFPAVYEGHSFPAIGAPSGLLFAALVLTERRHWGGWLLAACGAIFLSGGIIHGQVLPAAVSSFALALEASLGAFLLGGMAAAPFTIARVREVWAFGAAAVAASMAGATVAAAFTAMSGTGPSLTTAFPALLAGDLLGILLIAPLALAWAADRAAFVDFERPWRVAELVAATVTPIAVTYMVWADLVPPLLRVPVFALPPLLWAAFRFGPGGATLTVLAVSTVGLWYTALGRGPYTLLTTSAAQAIQRAQQTSGVLAFSLLLLAAVVAERKRVARERDLLVTELQQALAEIKTLQGMIPICAWCHKVRDDAGFWQRIETYLHVRTEATFSHGICPECTHQLSSQPDADVSV